MCFQLCKQQFSIANKRILNRIKLSSSNLKNCFLSDFEKIKVNQGLTTWLLFLSYYLCISTFRLQIEMTLISLNLPILALNFQVNSKNQQNVFLELILVLFTKMSFEILFTDDSIDRNFITISNGDFFCVF